MGFVHRLVSCAVVLVAAITLAVHAHVDDRLASPAAMQRRLLMQNALEKSCGAPGGARRLLQEEWRSRRHAELQRIRSSRSLTQAISSHQSNITAPEDPKLAFGDEVSCLLAPQSTEGPYYVAGVPLRNNIADHDGLDLFVHLQFVDVNTCQPVENLFVNMWHCNSTGVYSGVVADDNGNPADTDNINTTFHRGLAATDEAGIVSFQTKFPGHYPARTHHIHIEASLNGTLLPNDTYVGSNTVHIGQLYFDQELADAVEELEPYVGNTQPKLTNVEDFLYQEIAGSEFDSILTYVLLNETISDGLFSWMTIGVDTTQDRDIDIANTVTENSVVTIYGDAASGSAPEAMTPEAAAAEATPPAGSALSTADAPVPVSTDPATTPAASLPGSLAPSATPAPGSTPSTDDAVAPVSSDAASTPAGSDPRSLALGGTVAGETAPSGSGSSDAATSGTSPSTSSSDSSVTNTAAPSGAVRVAASKEAWLALLLSGVITAWIGM